MVLRVRFIYSEGVESVRTVEEAAAGRGGGLMAGQESNENTAAGLRYKEKFFVESFMIEG